MPPVDFSQVVSMTAHRPELRDQLIGAFVQTLCEARLGMLDASRGTDIETARVREIAHKSLSNARLFGASELEQVLGQLVALAHPVDSAWVRALVQKACRIIGDVVDAVAADGGGGHASD